MASSSQSKAGQKNHFKKFAPDEKIGAPDLDPKTYSDETLSEPRRSYRQIKQGFSKDLKNKDTRFILSEYVANCLSVEEEELRRFNEQVDKQVKENVEQLRVEAEKEGYAAGLKEGKEKAYTEEKARLAKSIEDVGTLVGSIVQAKSELGKQYEDALVEMAFRLADTIICYELNERPENISFCVKEILEKIDKRDDVRIRLPRDLVSSIDYIEEEIANVSRPGRVNFEFDGSLKGGDCVVESLSGEVSSFVDEKLDKLKELVLARVQENRAERAG